jgi:hypothetical protein
MIKIDKEIAMPPRPANSRGARTYPFAQMEEGDSFAVPFSKNARSMFHAMARRDGVKISCRKLVEDGKTVLRVWCVSPAAKHKQAAE